MEVVSPPRRGEVWLVGPGVTRGAEIRDLRPCLVVSPDELNELAPTAVVVPMTTGAHPYPFRVPCRFRGRRGHVVLDQVRVADRGRFVRRLGALPPAVVRSALGVLQQMFAA
jgi:mRNA interferase MazF